MKGFSFNFYTLCSSLSLALKPCERLQTERRNYCYFLYDVSRINVIDVS